MNRRSVILLLFFIVVFSCSFLLIYGKSKESLQTLEGLQSVYDSVEAANNAETNFIAALNSGANNPAVRDAIASLPDHGTDILNKMALASSSIQTALQEANRYR